MSKKNVLYIAGYGRSGSTLLERILSANSNLFGLGELSSFIKVINNENTLCSCGETIQKCELWSEVIKNIKKKKDINKIEKFQNKYDSIFSYFVKNLFNKNNFKEYKNKLAFTINSIYNFVPKETKYIIDSSKTARKSFNRPFIYKDIEEINLKVIHLIRDGRGCMWSNKKGSNSKMEKGLDPNQVFPALRTAINWPLANLSPQLFKKKYRDDYCRIYYENFVDDPKKTLYKIGNFIGEDLTQQINMLKNEEIIPLSHQLAGNRLRKKEKIILKKDVEWRERLNLKDKLIFWLFDWPFALLYNYK